MTRLSEIMTGYLLQYSAWAERMKKFSELFKKYRLRAEFETFAAFSNALAEKGYFYEESIFSHWQKGTRTPTNRQLLLKIIEIFVERQSIKTTNEANEFLSSAGQGYLTEKEIQELHIQQANNSPFQVPKDIVHFTGRKDILESIKKDLSHQNIFFLHGPAGVGKTAVAIKLGHLLRDRFPDGILWYKVDSSNVMDILLSIASLFGEDIKSIKDSYIRASVVRTLLAKKKVLLIFDNVTSSDILSFLLPNTSSYCVIFSSQEKLIDPTMHAQFIPVRTFATDEVLELFEVIFDKGYVMRYKKTILAIGEKLGNLPLALHIVAHVIATYPKKELALDAYLAQLNEYNFDLEALTYEDKNLFKTINIGFESLEEKTKNVFISLGVFEGKDFSLDAVAFINKLSEHATKQILQQLYDISFIDESDNDRFRMHPLMKLFARKQMNNSSFYLRAASYFEQLLNKSKDKRSQKMLKPEIDNIVYIFKKCYDAGYWDQLITLWNPLERFLSETNEIKKLRSLAEKIDTAPRVNKLQNITTIYLLFVVIYWIFLFISGLKTSFWNYLYGILWSVIPFIGGILGMFLSKKSLGFLETNIGKAKFFISAGVCSWGTGNVIWLYYNFYQNLDIPYPSFADIGYCLAGFFWIIGSIYLSRATGATFSLYQLRSKLFFLVIPIIIIIFSYNFLLVVVQRSFATDTPLKIFFDLVYPTIDIIILSIVMIIFGLSVNFFRGKYKLSLFAILAGFVGMYLCDFIFAYTTSVGIYYNGSFFELLFTFALYLLTWGTLSFYFTPKKKQF